MQQSIRPAKGPIQAKLALPGSKIMTQRALVLTALADGVSELSDIAINGSIRTLIHSLQQLGIAIQLDEKTHSCIVAGGNSQLPKKQATAWCAGSKTSARFLLAACAATPGVFYFDGSKTLRAKPFTNMLRILSRQGVQLIPNDSSRLPFTLIGSDSLSGGEINLNDQVNPQMLSALLMIAPLARTPMTFNIGELANHPSINITCALMADFGVLVHRIHQSQFMVPVPQRYQAKDISIEPDFAIAAYFFAAAAVTAGEVTIQPARHAASKQTDAKFIDILTKMGCHLRETNAGLSLSAPDKLQGIEVSLLSFTDTFYALAATAPFAKTPTRITHVGTLSNKESERMLSVKRELVKLNIHVETGADWIKIFPGKIKATTVNSQQDPRLAMMLSVIGLKVDGLVIEDTHCVAKVYPAFFSVWQKLATKHNINV